MANVRNFCAKFQKIFLYLKGIKQINRKIMRIRMKKSEQKFDSPNPKSEFDFSDDSPNPNLIFQIFPTNRRIQNPKSEFYFSDKSPMSGETVGAAGFSTDFTVRSGFSANAFFSCRTKSSVTL